MRDALSSPSETPNKLHFAQNDGKITKQHDQTAIVQKSGLVPEYLLNRRQDTREYEIKNEDGKAYGSVRIPEMWGFSIEGDGKSEGLNAFSYRFFPSEWSGDHVIRGFEALHGRLKSNEVPDADQDEGTFFPKDGIYKTAHASEGESLDLETGVALSTVGTRQPSKTWDSTKPPGINLGGSSKVLDQYLGIDIARFTAYPEWDEISRGQWVRFIMANLFGLVVQWGTSGPAIYVMYYSPPVVSFSFLSKI